MKAFSKALRILLASSAGCLGSLATFGLSLALAWALPFTNSANGKLASALLAAAAAIPAGSWLVVRLLPGQRWTTGALFGAATGLIGFGYTLGTDIRLLVFLPVTALLGALGGRMAGRASPILYSS